jgi:ABC-2 type transport system ATP-binding protein
VAGDARWQFLVNSWVSSNEGCCHNQRPAVSAIIQADGVSKFYGDFVAVRDISFSIPEGQIVAMLGPNGAGKTTMMKILTGYLAPSEGTVSIAGSDVGSNRIAAAARVGYLPENGPLYFDMTALEILRFFGEARGLEKTHLRSRIDDVIQQCSLQTIVQKPVGKLSKGLRQRVGLAVALLHDPPVLIVDEPTAGLDPNQVRQFREHIADLRQTKTMLISTHILSEVMAVADRVLLINNGRMVFDGRPAELTAGASPEETFYRLTHPE